MKGKTLWEVLFGQFLRIDHLKVLGCLCFVSTLPHLRAKFDPRSLPRVFVGYGTDQKVYKVYLQESRKIVVSKNVVFRETEFRLEC